MSLPLLVRPNSVIPIGNRLDRPDYDYSDGVTLQVYQLTEGKQVSVEIPGLDGKIETKFEIRRESNKILIRRAGPEKIWNMLLVGIGSVEDTENAESETLHGSTLIKLNEDINEMSIRLK
jgi:alpha-D-xyloside xylohydrolase